MLAEISRGVERGAEDAVDERLQHRLMTYALVSIDSLGVQTEASVPEHQQGDNSGRVFPSPFSSRPSFTSSSSVLHRFLYRHVIRNHKVLVFELKFPAHTHILAHINSVHEYTETVRYE